MKILLYTHSFAPLIGGAEKYVMLLAEGLAKLPSVDARARVVVEVATATPAGKFDDSQLPFGVVREPGLFSLAKLLYDADVVQLSGACFLPLLLGWILRKPIVIEHHGYNASCPNGLLFYEPTQTVCPGHFMARRYRKCIACNAPKEGLLRSAWALLWSFPRRWLCERAAVNVPITQHVLKRLALPRSHVVYYGIPDLKDHTSLMDARQPNAGPLCFAYVGRLVSLKGLALLLEASAILKQRGYLFRLKFIGDGPERKALESSARRLDLNGYVEFTGFASGERFGEEMRAVSAVIMPSIWEETAGLAAMEQMMRGRLVIASDIGGLGEIVGEAGLKCAPGDAATLAECMRRVLDRPEIVAEMGMAARTRALSLFRQGEMIDTYARMYQQLTQSSMS